MLWCIRMVLRWGNLCSDVRSVIVDGVLRLLRS